MDSGTIIALLSTALAALTALAGVWLNLDSRFNREREKSEAEKETLRATCHELYQYNDARTREFLRLQGEVNVLNAELGNVKTGVQKDLTDLKSAIRDLARELRDHIQNEPQQLERILRQVLLEKEIQ